MNNLDYITHLSKSHFNKIQKLTEPLLQQFGISYFARQSVTSDGYWEVLGNIPGWLEFSASKKFFNVDPSLIHPEHYQSGLVLNSSHAAPDFLKEMALTARDSYNIDHTLCIFEKTPTGGEWYFFATSPDNKMIFNTYIANIHRIFKYIKYFNHEAKKILNKNLDFRINLSQLKNTPFDFKQNKIDLAPVQLINDDFFQTNISAREKDCLRLLLKGKTIKETAKSLNLSPRTVEEYLNRLKQKTGCRYKRELIQFFQSPGF